MSAATPPLGGRALRSKNGVPYEMFLNIIDILISEAEVCATPYKFSLTYMYESPTKIAINPFPPPLSLNASIGPEEITKERFSDIRLASQINRKTRGLVHKTFRRIPMDPYPLINAWILPGIDDFIPLNSRDTGPDNFDRGYDQAIFLPTPSGHATLELIQRINLPVWEYFKPLNAIRVATLLALPNLKQISVDIGAVDIGGVDPQQGFGDVHYGIRPLDEKRFYSLANWMRDVPGIRRMWAPFKMKGVKLYAETTLTGIMLMELYPAKKRMYARYLRPNCDCDECKTIKQTAA
ncbi:hypothetical protein CcaCcLH18_12226 [Colletotrichum camelliae]|nr:hypothetical protein CcaCcLH18_12226 [Colletotrichum camelliae]